LVFVIGRRRSTWFVPILALGCFFSFRGVIASTSNFRMDSMALFFSASAVVLLGTRERGIGRVLLAAACGCLAIFTKQPSFAGLVSGFIFLAAVDRRNARIFALASGAILVAGGLFAQFYWGSGFWFCTLVVPQMPVMWKQFARLWVIVFHQPPALFVMAASGVVTAHSIYRHRWRVLLDSPYLIYLVVSTAVLMATVGKAGSALNYFVEPFLACLLWLTFALDDPDWSRGRNLAPSLAIALLCFCECVELAVIHPPEYYLQREHARSSEELLDRIRHEFESLGVREPRVLNVSRVVWQPLERMQEAYLEPRFVALNDSFLYNFVWGAGMVSPEPLRDAVMRREFDVVLVPRGLVIDDSTPRHLRRVVEAVRTRYLFTRSGVYDYYLKGSLNLNGSVNSVSQ